MLPPWKYEFGAEPRIGFLNIEAGVIAITRGQAIANVRKAKARFPRRGTVGIVIVFDSHAQKRSVHFRRDPNGTAVDQPRDSMLDCVLNQWLHDQGWHFRRFRYWVDLPLHSQSLAEADLLDLQVDLRQLQLMAEFNAFL